MIALTAFRVAAYVRSHRVYQALLLLLIMQAIVYGSRAPVGEEAAALADGAVLVIPILAWATRSLLDTEPDQQRLMSAVTVGGRGRELAAGLLAALLTSLGFIVVSFGWALLLGVSAMPSPGVFAAVSVLHGLAVLTGLAIGALTSRVILPSPAISIMALVFGFLVMLLLSASPAYWLTVPVVPGMKAAGSAELIARLPWLGAISLAWCAIGLGGYAWLRRTRP
jgi:hypothetical protein